MMITKEIEVTGIVQGIGFRPFVARIAEQALVSGTVENVEGDVYIVVSGTVQQVGLFEKLLIQQMPERAIVEGIQTKEVPFREFPSFTILTKTHSTKAKRKRVPLVIPDLPLCKKCEEEVLDKKNRRYQYPFISCVDCGPRYSILKELPYDRETTVMDVFPMCPECKKEYTDKTDRRRHAQTISCKCCGPRLHFQNMEGDAALQASIDFIKRGGILAIKDIGGYHLTCLAGAIDSVKELRILKNREEKPFAVMFEDVSQLRQYAQVSKEEEECLYDSSRPVVLVRKRKNISFFDEICKNSMDIGAMVPGNALQLLLVKECGPLVMTSANRSGEPMIIKDAKMAEWVASCGRDWFSYAWHEREILMPLDDSIFRVIKGRKQVLRRGRGLVPQPVELVLDKEPVAETSFCAGGDLKAGFAFLDGNKAYLSQHLGDLEDMESSDLYDSQIEHMKNIFGFEPENYVVDAHPGYYSRQKFKQEKQLELQHHKSHVLSVVMEHGLKTPVFGVSFDGTGYGDDGTIWGAEFFYYSENSLQHIGKIEPINLTGADSAMKDTNLCLMSYIASFSDEKMEKWLQTHGMDMEKYAYIKKAQKHKINTVQASSMGRLFDGVSALLGVCDWNTYEGQAACQLEYLAAQTDEGYPLKIAVEEKEEGIFGDIYPMFAEIMSAINTGVPVENIARGFMSAIVNYIEDTFMCFIKNGKTCEQMVLSGGTFLNRIILEQVIERMEKRGVKVYVNEQVPSGDGGICLGQCGIFTLGFGLEADYVCSSTGQGNEN